MSFLKHCVPYQKNEATARDKKGQSLSSTRRCEQLPENTKKQRVSTTLLFRTNVEDLPFLEKWSWQTFAIEAFYAYNTAAFQMVDTAVGKSCNLGFWSITRIRVSRKLGFSHCESGKPSSYNKMFTQRKNQGSGNKTLDGQ